MIHAASAQVKSIEFRMYGHASFPGGRLRNSYERGFTAGVSNYLVYTDRHSFLQSAELTLLRNKKAANDSNAAIAAISLGYRYKTASGLYFQVCPGIAFYNKPLGSTSGLLIANWIGYLFSLGQGGDIDISGRFNYATHSQKGFTWFSAGIGVAYKFKAWRPLFKIKKKQSQHPARHQ